MLSSSKPAAKGVVGLSLVTIAANALLNRLIAPLATSAAPFDPSVTDVLGYNGLIFLRDGEQMDENWIGLWFILFQLVPRWLKTLLRMMQKASIDIEGGVMETAELTSSTRARPPA